MSLQSYFITQSKPHWPLMAWFSYRPIDQDTGLPQPTWFVSADNDYLTGIEPPHYPLPAIPLRTVIADSYVFVEHINDNRLCFYSDDSGFPDLWAADELTMF